MIDESVRDDDWVMVDNLKDNESMLQRYRRRAKKMWSYYKRAKQLYVVYRVVRLIVNLYILYHTLQPLSL